MSQTIEDLWNGNIAPCEHCGAHDMQANGLFAAMNRSFDALSAGLSEEQKELLRGYQEQADSYLLRMMELAFCDGFCLGARFAAEVCL